MGTESSAIFETTLEGFDLVARGKVRDIYDLGDELLIVATDRISAFDRVFPDPIPDKGKVLNQISEFWFLRNERLVLNHVVSTEVDDRLSVTITVDYARITVDIEFSQTLCIVVANIDARRQFGQVEIAKSGIDEQRIDIQNALSLEAALDIAVASLDSMGVGGNLCTLWRLIRPQN